MSLPSPLLQLRTYEHPPETVVRVLNLVYSAFDALLDATRVHKIETVGEVYLCVGGCPVQDPGHAAQAAEMALCMMAALAVLRSRVYDEFGLAEDEIDLRIGLHSGPVAAGIVGIKNPRCARECGGCRACRRPPTRCCCCCSSPPATIHPPFRYKLIGDTVNTASRMESTCLPGRIQISAACVRALAKCAPGRYIITERGEISVKGKGRMLTSWLEGRVGEAPLAVGDASSLQHDLARADSDLSASLSSSSSFASLPRVASHLRRNSLQPGPALTVQAVVELRAVDGNALHELGVRQHSSRRPTTWAALSEVGHSSSRRFSVLEARAPVQETRAAESAPSAVLPAIAEAAHSGVVPDDDLEDFFDRLNTEGLDELDSAVPEEDPGDSAANGDAAPSERPSGEEEEQESPPPQPKALEQSPAGTSGEQPSAATAKGTPRGMLEAWRSPRPSFAVRSISARHARWRDNIALCVGRPYDSDAAPSWELAFYHQAFVGRLTFLRRSIVVATVVLLIFLASDFVDAYVQSPGYTIIAVLRYAVATPTLLTFFALTFSRPFLESWITSQVLTAAAMGIVGATIVAISFVGGQPGYGVLALFIVYCLNFSLLGLALRIAVLLLLVVAFVAGSAVVDTSRGATFVLFVYLAAFVILESIPVIMVRPGLRRPACARCFPFYQLISRLVCSASVLCAGTSCAIGA